MSDYVPDQYENRHTRDQLHAARRLSREAIAALQSVRVEFVALGGTEAQFAAHCGLSIEKLHELIGKHEDLLKLKQEGWRA